MKNSPPRARVATLALASTLRYWGGPRLCAAAVLGGLLFFGPGAEAEPAVVVASGPDAPLPEQRLLEALRSQLAELGVGVVLSTEHTGVAAEASSVVPADRHVLAFVWIEGTPGALVVHFYEPAGASLRERRIPVAGTDAASLEEVAIVVRSAANALLEREEPDELPAAPVPSTAPAPVPSARLTSSASHTSARVLPIRLSVGYLGGVYARELPVQHGVRSALTWRVGGSPWRLGAAFAWVAPTRRHTHTVTFVLRRTPLEAFWGYEARLGEARLWLGPEVAGGVDSLRRRTEQVAGTLESAPAAVRWTGYLSTRLRLAWEPTPRAGGHLSMGADFVLNRVEHRAGAELLVDPLRARPLLELGVSMGLP